MPGTAKSIPITHKILVFPETPRLMISLFVAELANNLFKYWVLAKIKKHPRITQMPKSGTNSVSFLVQLSLS